MDNIPQSIIFSLSAIGAALIAIKLGSFMRLFLSLFVLPGIPLSRFGPKGSWAVVTGASDGIGKEYALALAKQGFNIVLVSRTRSKLEILAAEMRNVQTRILAMDFAANKDSDYDALEMLIADLDVAILINNVGLSHDIPVSFLQTPPIELRDIITINCIGTLRITQLVAPRLVSRGKGLILTMASFGGIMPTPLLATYSGSKAFLQHWSTALGSELAASGVHVQLIHSYLVVSAMSKIRRTSLLVPTPKAFVSAALRKIGRSGGAQGLAYTCTPYWSHAILHWAISTFLGTTSKILLGYNKSLHENIRIRAVEKGVRQSKKRV